MHEVYENTALTPMRVARLSGYLDWASQPSSFKHYPEFLFRYAFGENPKLRLIELSRCVTSRTQIGGKPYNRLNTPSAGNLHPIELYVQIRSLKGVLSGIYHVDALAESLVLVREIEGDGLEHALGMEERFEGMIFIISCVPFRSEWKYAERAVRYCYLDAGHQAGAVQSAAALYGQDATILSGFDTALLNSVMGFKDEELVCAALAVGKMGTKSVKAIDGALMRVSPTDYCDTQGRIGEVLKQMGKAGETVLIEPGFADEESILQRRSARLFDGTPLAKESFEHFMHLLDQPMDALTCYTFVLQSAYIKPGLYSQGKCIKAGDYADEISHLLVDQPFVKEAHMVTVMTSADFGAGALISAGVFAHRLYLDAHSAGAGFTGIGAFYDSKLQSFLNTQHYILYVCALGNERP